MISFKANVKPRPLPSFHGSKIDMLITQTHGTLGDFPSHFHGPKARQYSPCTLTTPLVAFISTPMVLRLDTLISMQTHG